MSAVPPLSRRHTRMNMPAGKLVTMRHYIDTTYAEGSRPTPFTVRMWFETGVLPIEALIKRGRRYFVNLDKLKDIPNRLAEAATR